MVPLRKELCVISQEKQEKGKNVYLSVLARGTMSTFICGHSGLKDAWFSFENWEKWECWFHM